jgi:large subunit ribosomal protein L6
MSRLAAQPIKIPKNVQVSFDTGTILIKGPKGELSRLFRKDVNLGVSDEEVSLTLPKETILAKALIGTYASHIKNMIKGVTEGFEKKLIIEGVGYRAAMEGNILVLSVGFSHQVKLEIPKDLSVTVEKNVIRIVGIDKELVGSFSSKIRMVKKPEPYKGKGIRYEGEIIRRKQGKKAVT